MCVRAIWFVLAIRLLCSEGHPRSSNECTTDECDHVAQYFSDHMNPSVDPCHDFYDFVCGRFLGSGNADVFTEVSDVTIRRLRKMLSKDVERKDSGAFRKAKLFYNTCIKDETQKYDPIRPIYETINKLGGWPTRPDKDGNPDDENYLIPLVRKARQMGFDTQAIFSINIVPNVNNTAQRILVITPPPLVLPPQQDPPSKKDEMIVNDYMTLMLMIGFQFLQYTDSYASEPTQRELFQRIVNTLRFELLLSKIYPKSYQKMDVFGSYSVQTIADIQNSYPFLNWLKFIQAVLGKTVTIDSDEKVIFSGTEYFSDLQHIYNALKHKGGIIKDYVIWRYIYHSLRASLLLQGGERWRKCLFITVMGFEPIIAAKYIENYFSPSDKEPVVNMVHRLKKVMHKMFQEYDWIDPVTKQNILEKINAIVMRVAYTDDMLSSEISQSHWFNSLSISTDNYFSSVLRLMKLSLDKVAATLHKPFDRNQWSPFISTMSVNAFYIPIENSITIPTALLQKEIYSSDRPLYLNYGSIGFIVGHELSHALDDMGRFYDKYGNRNDSLWNPDTIAEYEKKERCLINQYDKYVLEKTGTHLNGTLTLGENMADNAGVRMAYKAYKMWVEENGAEERLPGLNYTPEQMFWISMANVWCSKLDEKTLRILSRIDSHAPAKFRVIGMVSNQDEFSKDFKCHEGSPMNPRKKCSFD